MRCSLLHPHTTPWIHLSGESVGRVIHGSRILNYASQREEDVTLTPDHFTDQVFAILESPPVCTSLCTCEQVPSGQIGQKNIHLGLSSKAFRHTSTWDKLSQHTDPCDTLGGAVLLGLSCLEALRPISQVSFPSVFWKTWHTIQAMGLHGLVKKKPKNKKKPWYGSEVSWSQSTPLLFNPPAGPQRLSHGRSGERCCGRNVKTLPSCPSIQSGEAIHQHIQGGSRAETGVK